jgi:hypothetical protein
MIFNLVWVGAFLDQRLSGLHRLARCAVMRPETRPPDRFSRWLRRLASAQIRKAIAAIRADS